MTATKTEIKTTRLTGFFFSIAMYQASAHPYTPSLHLSSFYLKFQDPSYLVVFDVDSVVDIFRGFYCEFCGGEFCKHNLRQKNLHHHFWLCFFVNFILLSWGLFFNLFFNILSVFNILGWNIHESRPCEIFSETLHIKNHFYYFPT